MEQFDAILVCMERTFQNGMSRNTGWLINIMAESASQEYIFIPYM